MQRSTSRWNRSLSSFGIITALTISSLGVTRASHLTGERSRVLKPVRAPVVSDAAAAQVRVSEAYGKLPLYFEANQGQTDHRVKFLSRGSGHALFLTSSDAVLVLAKRQAAVQSLSDGQDKLPGIVDARNEVAGTVLRMTFVGGDPQARPVGRDELSGKVHYFVGKDPTKWRTNVPTYAAVRYEEIYPGIDVVFYGNQRELEYDIVLSPGADPARVVLGFEGTDELELDTRGDLVLHAEAGTIRVQKPIIYQEGDGIRREVTGSYELKGRRQVGFHVAAYDRSRPLVIDPVLYYSTFIGRGESEGATGIAVDATGTPT
jgi:hypothetical protein